MGLFDKVRKKKEEHISEEEALHRTKTIYTNEELYIILSTKRANLLKGVSIPYVCQLPQNNQTGIILFSKKEYARKYIENNNFEILDGIYPIGSISTNDNYHGLNTIINIANALKIQFLDYNPGFDDNTLGCMIPWFMSVNHIDPEVSILMSQEQFENIQKDSGNIPLNFNPIPIVDFQDDYALTEETSKGILSHVFECDTSEKAFLIFSKESLFECCHTADYICTRMIPMAEEQKKTDDVSYFQSVMSILQMVIIGKLGEQEKLYTLRNRDTNEIVMQNGIAYILYTDRYKYMGQFDYEELPKEKPLEWLKEKCGTKKFMVTDGPHGMAYVELR